MSYAAGRAMADRVWRVYGVKRGEEHERLLATQHAPTSAAARAKVAEIYGTRARVTRVEKFGLPHYR